MTLLDRTDGENTGGLLELQCAPQLLLYGQVASVQLGPLTLTAADPWLLLYCTQETRYYRETEQESDNGPVWAVELGGFVPGDAVLVRGVMQALPWWRWVVRGRDNVGTLRQAGDATMALNVKADFGIDPMMSGDRGYALRFGDTLPVRPGLVIP